MNTLMDKLIFHLFIINCRTWILFYQPYPRVWGLRQKEGLIKGPPQTPRLPSSDRWPKLLKERQAAFFKERPFSSSF